MKRVALYIRVSTSKQDTENQRRELEAVAGRSGWKIVKVCEDAGISGAKGQGSTSWAGRHDESGERERVRHGRDMVSGQARSIAH